MRGFVYEAAGPLVPPPARANGERIVRRLAARNAIPLALLTADSADVQAWLGEARAAVGVLLSSA